MPTKVVYKTGRKFLCHFTRPEPVEIYPDYPALNKIDTVVARYEKGGNLEQWPILAYKRLSDRELLVVFQAKKMKHDVNELISKDLSEEDEVELLGDATIIITITDEDGIDTVDEIDVEAVDVDPCEL